MRPSLLLALLLIASPLAVRAEGVPAVLSHSGRLLEGETPVNGTKDVTFLLSETGDPNLVDPKWTETRSVNFVAGQYGVTLGDTRPGAGGTAFPAELLSKPELFLSVKIEGRELLPRQRISSTVYALRAGRAGSAEVVLEGGVSTASLQDESVTTAKLAKGSVTTDRLADGAVKLAKLDTSGGKLTGLDADLLDGFDSSAFAPAAIEGLLGTPPANSSIAKELADVKALATAGATAAGTTAAHAELGTKVDGVRALLGTPGGASLSADLGAIATEVGAVKARLGTPAASIAADIGAISTEVGTLKGRLGTPSAASLSADIAALATQLAAIKTAVEGRVRIPEYSQNCQDFASKGWKDEAECLRDGRWHLYFRMLGSGRQDQGGTATQVGFHAASKAGADTKARIGREWYQLSVRSVDAPTDFYVFVTDVPPFGLSFVVHPSSIDSVHVQSNPNEPTYNDGWRSGDLGNRHYLTSGYTHRGAFTDLNQHNGVEFWARY